MNKAAFVMKQTQTRVHSCHWPGCGKQVPPAMWGCRVHWFMLPVELRSRICAAYRPGQEVDGRPSAAYIDAANDAQSWISSLEELGR